MEEQSLEDPSPKSSTPKDHIETGKNEFSVLQDLQSRITKLEQVRFSCSTEDDNNDDENNKMVTAVIVVDNAMRRARRDVEMAGCYSAQWKWVPSHYYQLSLPERAVLLQVPTTAVLCKSLLMENKKWMPSSPHGEREGWNDEYNPKFVLVVLQYEATLNVTKLHVALQRHRQQHTKTNMNTQQQHHQHQQQQYDWRIASTEDNDTVTGYSFNSVTPFGLLTPVQIVLASAIVQQQECKYFVMGGGHVHLKLKMATSEFVEATNALVADVTTPRTGVMDDDEH